MKPTSPCTSRTSTQGAHSHWEQKQISPSSPTPQVQQLPPALSATTDTDYRGQKHTKDPELPGAHQPPSAPGHHISVCPAPPHSQK